MKVLIIEDDPVISETVAICFELRWTEAEIISANNGEEGVKLAMSQSPHIVILDVGLPGMDGYRTLRELRQFTEVPIIMLTAKEGELAKVKGLEYGAGDYMTKPFSHIELLARVRAVQRRAAVASRKKSEGVYCSEEAGLEIDLDSRRVTRFGQPINLAPLEYTLLKLLTRNEGRVMTHEEILAQVWGQEYIDDVDYLKVYVRRLRNKIGDDPQNTELIHAERGVGYIFQVRPKADIPSTASVLVAA